MQRDPKTGRFMPGNQIAVGNRGNRKPKWGNKNAMKHGFFGTIPIASVHRDGNLYIFISRKTILKVKSDGFIQNEDGRIAIRNDIAPWLEKMGVVLERGENDV